MKQIYVNQIGYFTDSPKKAVLNFEGREFNLFDDSGNCVYTGKVSHFGTDDISGEDVSVADFSDFKRPGIYRVSSEGVDSVSFSIGTDVFEKLTRDVFKCFYYLRCGDALSKEFAGEYWHEPCHMSKAAVLGEDTSPVDVSGGWHDAGDYGRYSTAGAVAVAHILYGVRFFDNLKDVKYDIPKVTCPGGVLPDILAEVKVELDFLLKMQREDGSVWHKVTTFQHAPFVMPEDDRNELFLYPVSSMATADIAAVFALAYTVYKDYDRKYADKLMEAALMAYKWLKDNPEPVLFRNPEGSNTGVYGESEDVSNRFWAAAALYEATGDRKYHEDAVALSKDLEGIDRKGCERDDEPDPLIGFGWGDVGGLGSLSLILTGDDDDLEKYVKGSIAKEADRLVAESERNGFGVCMNPHDFIWGSNMELLKHLMILAVADLKVAEKPEYRRIIVAGLDYLLGCNSMDVSYVTGNGEKAFMNPHLRPTAVDGIEDPWPGLVSGGPNKGLQDPRAREIPMGTAPMKCYFDHVDCYSLNEITIYWNSPLLFVLGWLRKKF